MPSDEQQPQVTAAFVDLKQGVLVAVIGGVFGLLGAIIQLWAQKPATEAKIAETFDRRLPVGIIVPSVLDPAAFATVAGDSGDFDTRSSAWVPADGRPVPGSAFAKRTGGARTPDLRGLFLRGLNYSSPNEARADGHQDPDGGQRKPGDFQNDALAKHSHQFKWLSVSGSGNAEVGGGQGYPRREVTENTAEQEGGASETRPRNAAVFYYVKIN